MDRCGKKLAHCLEFIQKTTGPLTDYLTRLVRTEVTDYGASWTVVAKKLAHCPEFVAFVDIFGVEAAQRIFR